MRNRFTVLALAAGAGVRVEEEQDQGLHRLRVDNGRLRFSVTPDYAAAITELTLDDPN